MNWKAVLKKHLETVPDSKYEWDNIKIAVDISQNISDDDWQRFLDEVKAMQKARRWRKIKKIFKWFVVVGTVGYFLIALYGRYHYLLPWALRR